MRKLFKNSFKSFLSSKLAMILLSLTVFLSIAVFTMLSSTSWAFNSSYNQVVSAGRLHDFTVKEKYTISGKTGITLKRPSKVETVYKVDYKKNTQTTDEKQKAIFTLNSNLKQLFKIETTKTVNGKQVWIPLDAGLKVIVDDTSLISDTTGKLIHIGSGVKLEITTTPVKSTDTDKDLSNYSWVKKQLEVNSYLKVNQHVELQKYDSYNFKNGYKITPLKRWNDIETTLIKDVIEPKTSNEAATKWFVSSDATQATDAYKTFWTGKTPSQTNDLFVKQGIKQAIIPAIPPATTGGNWTIPTETQAMNHKAIKQMLNSAEAAVNRVVSENISKRFIADTKKYFGNTIAKNGVKEVQSIYVNSGTNQYKLVNTWENKEEVDKLVLFKGNKPQKRATEDSMVNNLIKYIQSKHPGITVDKKDIDKLKEFKYTYSYKPSPQLPPFWVESFVDPSSYQAVITDGYAKSHKIQPISQEDLKKFNAEVIKDPRNTDAVFQKYAKHVQKIDGTKYIITGIGTTPDFSFPIINQQNPLPNTKTQAILFTNGQGYNRIIDAFRGNQKENYLAFKFKDGVSKADKKATLKGISQLATTGYEDPKTHKKVSYNMTWGKTINPVSEAFDTNEKVILAPQRIAFLQKLKQSITTITFLTTALLAVLTGFIILMVIKKQISTKRKILGTLLANGYSKNQIAWSMTSIAFIIILIPASLGYVCGHFMQGIFIGMFDNYWTLPIYNHSFSVITLLETVVIPIIIVIIFAYGASRLALKGNLISILGDSQSKTAGWITAKVLKPFAWLGVKSKITISLFTSNLSKMVLVFITTAITMVAGGIAFSIMGRFNYALHTSRQKVNYNFKVDLASPTAEGGLMGRITPEEFGARGKKWSTYTNTQDYKQIFKEGLDTNVGSYMHVPGISDATEALTVNYLKNRLQFKSILNSDISGSNPWKQALATMPENQQNIARDQEAKFVKSLEKWMKTHDGKRHFTSAELDKITGPTGFLTEAIKQKYEFNPSKISKNPADKELYRKFLFWGIRYQVEQYTQHKDYTFPYFISYNNVTMDNDDELYTHLDVDLPRKNLFGNQELIQTTITGINPKTKMVNLDKGLLERFNKFTYDVSVDNDQVVPIIINKYFKEAYQIKEGEILNFTIKNHKDRYHDTKVRKTRAMVIGIQESYDGPKIYTTQSIANSKLGWTNAVENKKAFNGVYSKRKSPMIFQNISLYSDSGIQPGTDTIKNNSADPIYKNIAKHLASLNNPRVKTMNDYFSVYGKSPYISTFSSANWAAMSDYAFRNILDLSGKLIWMVEGIAIFIAVLFVAIIASMVISDNKKFIATMKVLGYRNKEIRRMFFRSLIPAILIGLAIAVPVTIGALFMIKAIIISFGAILVPVSMMGWELVITFFLITFAFMLVYYLSMRKLGNEEMLEAFKA